MKRKYLIVGNWKMNTDLDQAVELAGKIGKGLDRDDAQTVLCPPHVFIEQVFKAVKKVRKKNLAVGAQNISWEKKGAYTGDISIDMVKPWAKYAIIGHSERRHYFAETNALINTKIKLALTNKITPILCVGEKRFMSSDLRDLGRDLIEGLDGLTKAEMKKVVVAYEPVWAIGTGKAALPNYVNKILKEMRLWLKDEKGFDVAEGVRMLYGGSVNSKNAKDYLQEEQVDGLLIGGASLKPGTFLRIVKAVPKDK